ncbi:MAG: ADP-ribose pyrophosphatase [Candidatus Saganbacteria bacterium]|uniref:ADP-ribose pyrophosphatase n=1 Tax=Candidatus Saganbacteria bacterium TaxID=2575572 RepID=A0A833L0I2_UNCSA|nr:MAG: ADP-ribose pyrophosphatase [Candidatus Saganbacteria bacterium]
MREKTIKSKRIYKGRYIGLRDDWVCLATGRITRREICEHPGAVAVIAVTPKKEIVLIRQFRKPAEKVLYEIPAGLVDNGESQNEAARRELKEETGYKTKKIKKVLSAFTTPGYSTEVLHYFLAEKLSKHKQECEDDEHIEVALVPIDKAVQMVKSGKIDDNKTIIGIMYAKWMI